MAAALLGVTVTKLVRLSERKQLLSVPLLPEQVVEFPAAGKVVMSIAGPRLTRRFHGLKYRLYAQDSDTPVPERLVLFRTRRSGLREVSLAVEQFSIPKAGKYVFRIEGLAPQGDYAGHRIEFAKPFALELVAYVLAIIFFSAVLIVSLVFIILCLAGKVGNS